MPRTPPARPALTLWGAGSLAEVLGGLARLHAARSGQPVETRFGPSGTLRAAIEAGAAPDVFAAADMGHPEALARAGRAHPPRQFAGNALVALVQPGLAPALETADARGFVELLLAPSVRLATSLPGADPSGDYAQACFARAEALIPGAEAALTARALRLAGGPGAPRAPQGANHYGWVMARGLADIFLTYRSNARLALADEPALRAVALPGVLHVDARFGLCRLRGARPGAAALERFLLGAEAAATLRAAGFRTT
ncbi:extracellular solute-binding protein [Oceanicella sp. SM1341]|uniref:extracellular solute-binding protein n=1 Tax=Oceanicella sp. SM1341 TaxID=1548889 RepID=UPI0013006F29|nr:extracellular solute-binding protein [Oceanicella sp. SM1341]